MAAADYSGMLELINAGSLHPHQRIGRTAGLDDAAVLLPGFNQAKVTGMTMIDPNCSAEFMPAAAPEPPGH